MNGSSQHSQGRETPEPHAWDDLMAENIEPNQPLLPPGTNDVARSLP